MALTMGTAVGPYEILAPIGAGGMGEVYRARDPRIGRDVAVKVLPSTASGEPERQRRFEKEARAAGALNHPNVLAVYDVGTHDGVPYIVSELLEGETLRRRIGGSPLPTRKTLDYAVQIARGLAAAHEKGIVHRDLKPDNLFVTKDGRVKILDFGLAKLGDEHSVALAGPASELSAAETATGTLPGSLLGTLGYMSPEQVQGHIPDARSDIFAFGAVLFKMLTGRRAFKVPTAPETLTAILNEDPLETPAEEDMPPGLERVVRHCLEKSPDERFQSARDLAFALEALSGAAETVSTRAPRPEGEGRRRRAAARAAALLMAAGLGLAAGWGLWQREMPGFSQLTFRAGLISSARFSPDGQTIVYSAAWDGGPLGLHAMRPGETVSRPFGPTSARVLSISPSGEVAIQLLGEGTPAAQWLIRSGTLARVPLAGGTPREMLEDVLSADWSPDGSTLAVSRLVEGVWRLEYPIGNVLYESDERITIVRVSPGGNCVAFLEEVPAGGSFTSGRISVVDRAGERTSLFEGWGTVGIAWSASGREIWTHAYEGSRARSIRAVSLDGKSRLVAQLGGAENYLADVSRDGRVLFAETHGRHTILARPPDEDRERNLSWLHDSSLVDLSRDGQFVLFNEILSGAGRRFHTSVRSTDGSPAVRLGEGYGLALSPDDRWALALTGQGPSAEFVLLPTGAGDTRRLSEGLPEEILGASWLPDSSGFVFSGSEPGATARLFQLSIEGGRPQPLTDPADDLVLPVLSPDGETIAAHDVLYDDVVLVRRRSGGFYPLVGTEKGEQAVEWSSDGEAVYVYQPDRLPVELFEVDIASGQRRRLEGIVQGDLTGIDGDVILEVTPDARSYAYSFYRPLDELYLIQGLR
jgi:Tol biopolymer transport system component